MKSLLESLTLLRQDMELPEAQSRPVHAYYKQHLDALIKAHTPQGEPLKRQGDPRRAFYAEKLAQHSWIESFFSELLPVVLENGDNLRVVAAEDVIHRAQQILSRHLTPDGPTAQAAINELLALLDSPVANALTRHLRE